MKKIIIRATITVAAAATAGALAVLGMTHNTPPAMSHNHTSMTHNAQLSHIAAMTFDGAGR